MLTRGARQRRILHGRPRIILFSGICLALLPALLTAVGYFAVERARLQSAKETAAHILGDSLALVSTELLSSNKQSAAQSYLDRVAAHSFVESASLYSQDAQLISATSPEFAASCAHVVAKLPPSSVNSGTLTRDSGGRPVYVRSLASPPPTGASAYPGTWAHRAAGANAHTGILVVWPSVDALALDNTAYVARMGAVSLGTLALLAVFVFLSVRARGSFPLRRVSAAVREDDIDQVYMFAHQAPRAEFPAPIASCHTIMAAEQQYTGSLEETVEERTQELRTSAEHLKLTQSPLIQQEKLASLGKLTAGIAHEINNPSGYVKSNMESLAWYAQALEQRAQLTDRLVQELSPNRDQAAIDALTAQLQQLDSEHDLEFIRGDLPELVDASIEGMDRITNIVRGLCIFCRTENGSVESVDLAGSIRAALAIVHNELKYDYTVEVELQPNLATRACLGQLEQVFVNMLMNARDATPPGGSISVRLFSTQETAVVSISDTGSGIPAELLDKIFDPFFTTKAVGAGTGLGLTVTHQIVQSIGGSITVTSEPREGTTFEIRIPTVRTG